MILDGQHRSRSHLPRRSGCEDDAEISVQIARETTERSRGVAEADVDLLDVRLAIAERVEPFRRTRSAACGIDDEISRDVTGIFASTLDANALDAIAIDEQIQHARAVENSEIGQFLHTATKGHLE